VARRGLPPRLVGKLDCTREVLTLSELTGSILPLRDTLTCAALVLLKNEIQGAVAAFRSVLTDN
jgi:hypothetical protein